jgi:hypothetical protein
LERLQGLFILALAIERALEPFSAKLGPDKARRTSRSEIEMCRQLTAVVTWGVATGLGFLLCAALNITLLQAVRANGSGQPPFWADLLVTGLVVGAGTKPLHDLVCIIERGKQARQKPPQAVDSDGEDPSGACQRLPRRQPCEACGDVRIRPVREPLACVAWQCDHRAARICHLGARVRLGYHER